MDQDRLAVNQISEGIIGCAFRVMNTLGIGFLEKVYENALAHELRKACPCGGVRRRGGLHVSHQHAITVSYDGVNVGDYAIDLLVEGMVIVELKAAKALDRVHVAQCINYLKASNLRVCLLLNFGKPRLEIQRIVH